MWAAPLSGFSSMAFWICVSASSNLPASARALPRLLWVCELSWIHGKGALVGVDGLSGLAGGGESHAHVVEGARIGGILGSGDLPGGDGGFVLVLVLKLLGEVELAVEIDGGSFDVVEGFSAEVDEFRNVDGAIGGRGVFHEDRRAGVACRRRCV